MKRETLKNQKGGIKLTAKSSNGVFANAPIAAMITIALAAAFLLCGYELVRSPAKSFYIGVYGSDKIPYAMLGGALLTLLFVYGYGWLITLLGTRRTIFLTSLFSAAVIIFCYVAIRNGSRSAVAVLYVFREAYIVVVLEQYWSFVNSILHVEQAKKFNGPFTGIASLGAIVGALIVGRYAELIGSETLLLFGAVSILPAALFSDISYRLGGEPAPSADERGLKSIALSLFKDSSYLRRIGLLIILTQLVSATFGLRLWELLENSIVDTDARTAYMGNLYASINISAGVLQFVVAPIVLHYIAFKFIHPGIPIIHIGAAALLIARPSLFTGALAYFLFKSFDYSIFRASKEIFYIPLSFDCRYRAKEVIDSFGYRASKGGVGGILSLANMIFKSIPGVTYAVVAMGSAFTWMLTVKNLVRQHDDMLEQDSTNSGEQET